MIVRLLPILGITFIDILGFSILIPLMPFFVKRFGVPDVVVGALFAVFALCQLVAGPVWGNVSDRVGRKAVLMVSQVGATIGWAMLAVAPNIAWVFAARVVEGVSGGNISVTQAYVADLVEPEKRGRAFALVGAAFGAGFIFGPATGGWLAERYGFAVPFLLAAGLQLVTLVVTWLVLPESRSKVEREVQPTMADVTAALRDRRVAPVMWQKLVYALGLYGWFASFTLVINRQLGWNAAQVSTYFALVGVISVVMQLGVVGRLTDGLGDRRASNLGFVVAAAAFACVPFMHDLVTALIVLVLFGFGISINNAALPALVAEVAPATMRGTILGVASSLESVAGIVMPPITTGVLQAYGVPPTAAIAFGFVVVALIVGLARPPSVAVAASAAD